MKEIVTALFFTIVELSLRIRSASATPEAAEPSFLVLTDTFYPGWNAYVGGSAEPTYRAYGVVRAVFVGAGSHEVLFKYEPESFRIGSYVSLLSSSIVALLLVTSQFSRFCKVRKTRIQVRGRKTIRKVRGTREIERA